MSAVEWTAERARERFASFDDATLEREYSPSSMIGGDFLPYVRIYTESSAAARSKLEADGRSVATTIRYGDRPDNVVDVFVPAGLGPHPLVVFFHGGYWRALSHLDASFPAASLLHAGVAYASVGYTLAPAASLTSIVAEARAAVRSLVELADALRVDVSRITLGGHSAGAHLACMTAEVAAGLTEHRVGLLLVAGVFELLPLTRMSVNHPLHLTPREVASLSPLRHAASIARAVSRASIVWGETDTREFAWQSRLYAELLQSHGVDVSAWEQEGRNHYDLPLDLADRLTRLGRAAFNDG